MMVVDCIKLKFVWPRGITLLYKNTDKFVEFFKFLWRDNKKKGIGMLNGSVPY